MGLEMEKFERDGLKGLFFVDITQETIKFHSATCSFIVELIEAA
jgi:hypothetical protein